MNTNVYTYGQRCRAIYQFSYTLCFWIWSTVPEFLLKT